MFSCCMCPSNVCISRERVLEVELYCECHMPELSEDYVGFPTGLNVHIVKSGIMTVAEKFLVLKYVKQNQINQCHFHIFKYFSIFICLFVSVCMFMYRSKSLCIVCLYISQLHPSVALYKVQ